MNFLCLADLKSWQGVSIVGNDRANSSVSCLLRDNSIYSLSYTKSSTTWSLRSLHEPLKLFKRTRSEYTIFSINRGTSWFGRLFIMIAMFAPMIVPFTFSLFVDAGYFLVHSTTPICHSLLTLSITPSLISILYIQSIVATWFHAGYTMSRGS